MIDDNNSNPNVGDTVIDADIKHVILSPKVSRNNRNVTISSRQRMLHKSPKKKRESTNSKHRGCNSQELDVSEEQHQDDPSVVTFSCSDSEPSSSEFDSSIKEQQQETRRNATGSRHRQNHQHLSSKSRSPHRSKDNNDDERKLSPISSSQIKDKSEKSRGRHRKMDTNEEKCFTPKHKNVDTVEVLSKSNLDSSTMTNEEDLKEIGIDSSRGSLDLTTTLGEESSPKQVTQRQKRFNVADIKQAISKTIKQVSEQNMDDKQHESETDDNGDQICNAQKRISNRQSRHHLSSKSRSPSRYNKHSDHPKKLSTSQMKDKSENNSRTRDRHHTMDTTTEEKRRISKQKDGSIMTSPDDSKEIEIDSPHGSLPHLTPTLGDEASSKQVTQRQRRFNVADIKQAITKTIKQVSEQNVDDKQQCESEENDDRICEDQKRISNRQSHHDLSPKSRSPSRYKHSDHPKKISTSLIKDKSEKTSQTRDRHHKLDTSEEKRRISKQKDSETVEVSPNSNVGSTMTSPDDSKKIEIDSPHGSLPHLTPTLGNEASPKQVTQRQRRFNVSDIKQAISKTIKQVSEQNDDKQHVSETEEKEDQVCKDQEQTRSKILKGNTNGVKETCRSNKCHMVIPLTESIPTSPKRPSTNRNRSSVVGVVSNAVGNVVVNAASASVSIVSNGKKKEKERLAKEEVNRKNKVHQQQDRQRLRGTNIIERVGY